jgi:hypothetical protein
LRGVAEVGFAVAVEDTDGDQPPADINPHSRAKADRQQEPPLEMFDRDRRTGLTSPYPSSRIPGLYWRTFDLPLFCGWVGDTPMADTGEGPYAQIQHPTKKLRELGCLG